MWLFFIIGFLISHFKYVVPLLLSYRISAEKSANSLMRAPLYVISCSSLTAFTISFSLFLNLLITVNGSLWVHLVWDSLHSLDLGVCSAGLRNFSAVISSGRFSLLFSLFSFWDIYNVNVSTLDVFPRSHTASLFFIKNTF